MKGRWLVSGSILVASMAGATTFGACSSDSSDPAPTRSSSKRIGPAGGSFSAFGVTIDVPAGAVAAETEFSIQSVTAPTLPEGVEIVGNAYELGPSGVEFQKPVRVTLPFPAGVDASEHVMIRLPTGKADWVAAGAPTQGATSVAGFMRGFSIIANVRMLFRQAKCFAPQKCDLSCNYESLTCEGSCTAAGGALATGATCGLTSGGRISCECNAGGSGLAPRRTGPFEIDFIEGLMRPQLLLLGIADHCGWPCDVQPTPSDGGADSSADGGGGGSCGASGPKTPTIAYDLGAVVPADVRAVAGGRVYYASTVSTTNYLSSVSTDGTGNTPLSSLATPTRFFAVQPTAAHVYFSEGVFNQAGGKVRRYPLPSGPAEDVVGLTDVYTPWGLWVDDTVYVAQRGMGTEGVVRTAGAEKHEVPCAEVVAADATHVYFNQSCGPATLNRLPRDLSGARVAIMNQSEVGALGESVRDFVVDQTNAYVLANNNNLSYRIRRRAKDGSGAVEDVITPLSYDGFSLTSDSSCLYFCSTGYGPQEPVKTNKIWGVSKTGTNQVPNVIVSDAVSCGTLRGDATHLYWAHSGKIWRVAK